MCVCLLCVSECVDGCVLCVSVCVDGCVLCVCVCCVRVCVSAVCEHVCWLYSQVKSVESWQKSKSQKTAAWD